MTQVNRLIGLFLCLWLVGCAAPAPAGRLGHYVLYAGEVPAVDQPLPLDRPIRVALVLIPDSGGPDAAPSLPDEALRKVADELKAAVSRGYPLIIDRVVHANELPPVPTEPFRWNDLAARLGTSYVLLAVLTSMEQEYPVSLFLGWTTHRQPGFRRDNWSLAEAALIEGATGRVMLHAEGRAWATLDSPTAPGISQWYPVIYLRPQDPERRIWPPTYEGAPITLRLVAMEQAVLRLASDIQRAWIRQRELEIERAH
ncbi:MAG: hypothetical protein KF814_04440 [Nitrospiraceae bacterium]|nr:hypothetical protein [Nitrospiraceae bacterium]